MFIGMSSLGTLSSVSLVSDALVDRLDGRLLPINELQNNVISLSQSQMYGYI